MASKKKPVKKSSNKSISIVIPCYNEENRISTTIKSLSNFKKSWKSGLEFIFVDDGSTDGTLNTIKDALLKYGLEQASNIIILDKNSGKGAALKKGIELAKNDMILTMDADNAVKASRLNVWLKSIDESDFQTDTIYIGSRELDESKVEISAFRRITGLIFNSLIQFFTAINFKDSQCGFKLYPKSIGKQLFSDLRSLGWAHDVEILNRAIHQGIEIKTMPVNWTNVDGSKINVFRDSIRMLGQTISIGFRGNLNHFFIRPLQSFKIGSDGFYRLLFASAFLLALIIMPFFSFDFGVTGDEEVQRIYGDKALLYYESLGENKSCLDYKNLYFYGAFYETLTSAITKYFFAETVDPYSVRHFVNAIFGALLILFTGKLAYKISNSWKVAFWALLFCFLYPRLFGHSMNNPKDIPFACFFTLGLSYIVAFYKEFPRVSIKTIIGFIAGFGFALGIRVGAFLLIPFLGLFGLVALIYHYRSITLGVFRKVIISGLAMTGIGYLLGILFWPYALEAPFKNPFIAFSEMSDFSTGIRMLFNDAHYWSDNLPSYYLPMWLYMASTIVVLIGLPLFIFKVVQEKGKQRILLLLMVFVFLFPPVYAIVSDASYYDGIRHFLFIIPSMIALSSMGWIALQQYLPNKLSWSSEALMAGLCVIPLIWIVRSHPNQYMYFNELTGGLKGNYGYNETDYWMNSLKETCEWFEENELPKWEGREVRISTNAYIPVNHYLRQRHDNVKLIYTAFIQRTNKDSDYEIFFPRFVNRELLQNDAFPPAEVIYTAEQDGTVMSSITKRINGELEEKGMNALNSRNFLQADSLLGLALINNEKDEELLIQLASLYLQTNQGDNFISTISKIESFTKSNPSVCYFKGMFYMRKNDSAQAIEWFEKAVQYNYKLSIANFYLAGLYAQENRWKEVFDCIVQYELANGNAAQAYSLGIQSAEQLGERAYLALFKARKAEAEKDYGSVFSNLKTAVNLNPSFDRAQELLDAYERALKQQQSN
jgi:glycosyltransferase involved in cell wall biosynthesis/tetratricopeptide (TPR) repeat protein